MAYSPYSEGSGYWVNPQTRRVEQIGAGAASATAKQPTNVGYQIAPQPTTYSGAHGGKVGSVGLPDVAGQLNAQLPQNQAMKQKASSNIMSDLSGEINPETIQAIQEATAQWGVNAGIPGAGLAVNRGLRDVGMMSEDLQQRGIKNYNELAGQVSQTQTIRPETQISTSIQNALNRAAPDPQAAAQYAESLFNKYMEKAESPTGTMSGFKRRQLSDDAERGRKNDRRSKGIF